jgi:hypothetical protein
LKKIQDIVDINSSSQQVWQILTDFNRYPEWNPFIKNIQGELKEGAKLKVQMQPPGSKLVTLNPVILKIKPLEELRWKGQFGIPGLFSGEHIFNLKSIDDNKIQFAQSENFSGILVPFLSKSLKNTLRGFEGMNQSLKLESEK